MEGPEEWNLAQMERLQTLADKTRLADLMTHRFAQGGSLLRLGDIRDTPATALSPPESSSQRTRRSQRTANRAEQGEDRGPGDQSRGRAGQKRQEIHLTKFQEK